VLSFSPRLFAKSFWVMPLFSRASRTICAKSETTVSMSSGVAIFCFFGVNEVGLRMSLPNLPQGVQTFSSLPSTIAVIRGASFPHSSQGVMGVFRPEVV